MVRTYHHFAAFLRAALLDTGEVPPSERSSPVGAAWREFLSYHLDPSPEVIDRFLAGLFTPGPPLPPRKRARKAKKAH